MQNAINAAVEMKNRAGRPRSGPRRIRPAAARVALNPDYKASAVYLRKKDWRLMRRVAEARSDANGGRSSVSKVVEGLIDQARRALEKEAEAAL